MYLSIFLQVIGLVCVYCVRPRIQYGSSNEADCQNIDPKQNMFPRNRRAASSFNDPMYSTQWYLTNGVMKIKEAWDEGYNGKDVVISVLDTGLEKTHDEFKKRYDASASYNFVSNTTDPTPDYVGGSKHGTNVAGIVAGEANNGKCGVGVAYGAKIGGVRFIDTSGGSVAQGKDYSQNAALSFNRNHIDIYTCAWGPDDSIGSKVGYNLAPKAMADGTKHGRNGKGSLFVFGAGNEGIFQDSCGYDGYITSIHTLAISVVNSDGKKSNVSERCPAIIGVTQTRDGAKGVLSNADPMATADLQNKCSNTFSATSAAAAVASGMLALVLQANKDLTWRDVQHIITRTSINDPTKVIDVDNGWKTNGAGFKVSDRFGFGILDAMAMIKLAKNWTTVRPQISCEHENAAHRAIPSTGSLTDKIKLSNTCGITKLEHVVLLLNLTFTPRRDLQVEVKSPSSLVSYMLLPRKMDFGSEIKMYSTMSMHYWGENPAGEWEVLFKNANSATKSNGTLKYYKLIFYGTSNVTAPATPTAPTTLKGSMTTPESSAVSCKGISLLAMMLLVVSRIVFM
ncbi:endoprotease bli-like isoform X2 [Hydractinia symbiolongicarpus]|uniref:endoprotease bli-like isoform X2 n=1 Tax=Hydractinia symbiolongicarpus TaxID=13093 RepID=UPI00254EC295|nr:endoprotease bli-like isoform X2 [Hydractinia symbiolongicarpus]